MNLDIPCRGPCCLNSMWLKSSTTEIIKKKNYLKNNINTQSGELYVTTMYVLRTHVQHQTPTSPRSLFDRRFKWQGIFLMLLCWCNTLTNICSTGERFPLQPGLDKRQQRRASCHHNVETSAELRVTAGSAGQDMGSDKAVATVITLLTICLLLTNTSAGLLQVHSDLSFYFYLCRELLIFIWFWVVFFAWCAYLVSFTQLIHAAGVTWMTEYHLK